MDMERTTAPVKEWLPLIAGFFLLYVPTYYRLSQTLWSSDEQGHGPIVLAIAMYFLWARRHALLQLASQPAVSGWPLLAIGLGTYVIGRALDIPLLETGSQIPVLAAALLLVRGWRAVRLYWFPLFFLAFMVPLPGALVDTLTMPMKMAVSWAAETLLFSFGFPIYRSGVILQAGQYKLQVADACAGLHTLFTLEAMGLLYLHVMKYDSVLRNVLLAITIVPISFIANTIRVIALVLITYYFGDAAGQGFLHGFAGMVLFMSALVLIFLVDTLIGAMIANRWKSAPATGDGFRGLRSKPSLLFDYKARGGK
jgi:exosortase B